MRVPVHFGPGRVAAEHVWCTTSWESLHKQSQLASIRTLTCSDTVATSIWLSGVLHRPIGRESKGGRVVLSDPMFDRIQAYARALNRFPCVTLCPGRYGHVAYRQMKRALRKLVLERASPDVRSISLVIGWHDGHKNSLSADEMICCGFRDSADCLELALPRSMGSRPVAQVVREGALLCHEHTPIWTYDSKYESEDEWDNDKQAFARSLACSWLREHYAQAQRVVTSASSLFLGDCAENTGFVPRGPVRADLLATLPARASGSAGVPAAACAACQDSSVRPACAADASSKAGTAAAAAEATVV